MSFTHSLHNLTDTSRDICGARRGHQLRPRIRLHHAGLWSSLHRRNLSAQTARDQQIYFAARIWIPILSRGLRFSRTGMHANID